MKNQQTSEELFVRPEFECKKLDLIKDLDIKTRLSLGQRIWKINAVRKLLILLGFILIWEAYTRLGNVEPLLFPNFTSTILAFIEAVQSGLLLEKIWISFYVLLIGYVLGIFIAAVLLVWAVSSRIGRDFLSTMTAMFQPLPAITLLPLAMLWFGLGIPSLVFVTVHSVLWAVSLSTLNGFLGVSSSLRMVGKNYGLGHFDYIVKILVPASLGSILVGLKVGWAFAWRTLIGAELVFGAASGRGGLGWMIYEEGSNLETPLVFAGLFTVILIGLFVENLIFRKVEINTLEKWGMQN